MQCGIWTRFRDSAAGKERKELIKDLLSEELDDGKPITSQIGMNYAGASKVIDVYWKELTRKGYTISEVLEKDWGDVEREPVLSNFQQVIKVVLKEFEEKYTRLKLDKNAISINDLFFDFGHYLLNGKMDCRGLTMKYLFVDEFQDTDATQIRTFARLVQTIHAKLFAVGDVKQSITPSREQRTRRLIFWRKKCMAACIHTVFGIIIVPVPIS